MLQIQNVTYGYNAMHNVLENFSSMTNPASTDCWARTERANPPYSTSSWGCCAPNREKSLSMV